MALYRNIAGIGDEYQYNEQGPSMGYAFLQPIETVTVYPSNNTSFPHSIDDGTVAAQAISRYDWLLSHSTYEISQAGYYVESNGSIFQWTDAGHTTSVAYLPIQDIQEIENSRGTAGTLLMHLNEPVIAKDTAGYGGGGTASGGSTTQYSNPIDEVANIPPPAGGPNVINDYTPPILTNPLTTPLNGDSSNSGPPPPSGGPGHLSSTNKTLPLVALAGLALVAVTGAQVFKKTTNLVFVGSLGLLYYTMNKK